jgi:hypothetical protein
VAEVVAKDVRQNVSEKWIFMVPVGNVVLHEDIEHEFEVDRVTFMHRDKLPPEVKMATRRRDFFESAETFAVVRGTGTPDKVERECLELVRQESSILALSQLGFATRKQMRPVVPMGEVSIPYLTYLAVSRSDQARSFGKPYRTLPPVLALGLDGLWKDRQDEIFFTNLLRILQRATKVDTRWRKDLRRASLMIGECVGADDLLKSFIWNCAALETLLTRRREMSAWETLPKRIGALLYWVFYSESERADKDDAKRDYERLAKAYDDRIDDVIGKRNGLLHNSERERIAERDLVFTDHLLLNVITNLVRVPQLFDSKTDVIQFQFADEIEENRSKGASPRECPADFIFVGSIYTGF